jgi:hypothetical protein
VVESPALALIASAHGLFLLTGFKMNITCHTSDDINTTVVLPNGHPAGQTHLTHAIRCFLTLALVLRLGLDFPSTLTGGLDCPVSTSLVSWLGLDVAASTCPGQTHSWLPHGETWK